MTFMHNFSICVRSNRSGRVYRHDQQYHLFFELLAISIAIEHVVTIFHHQMIAIVDKHETSCEITKMQNLQLKSELKQQQIKSSIFNHE